MCATAVRSNSKLVRRLCTGFSVLIVVVSVSSNGLAQSHLEEIKTLSTLVGDDVAATIHIPDFKGLLDQVQNHKAFTSTEFRNDMELVIKHNPQVVEQWDDLIHGLRQVKSLHVFAWKEKPDLPEDTSPINPYRAPFYNGAEFVVLLKASQATELAGCLEFFKSCIAASSTGMDSNSHVPSDVFTATVDGWFVIGNSSTRVDELKTKLGNLSEANDKLGNDRRFQIALAEFANAPNSLLFGFARPERFPELFSDSRGDADKAKLESLDELPASAITVQFDKETGNIIVRSFVSNTLPAMGLASKWNAYRPIPKPYPEFCFRVRSTEFHAWDPKDRMNANMENYDRVHGSGKYKEMLKQRYSMEDEQQFEDLFNNTCARFYIRHEAENGLYESITIEKVHDYDAARRTLESSIKLQRESGEERRVRLTKLPESDPDAIGYGPSAEWLEQERQKMLQYLNSDPEHRAWAERNYWRAIKKAGRSVEEIADLMVENDGTVLTRKWLFKGNVVEIYQLIDFMNGQADDKENQLDPLKQRIDWLVKQSDFGQPHWLQSGEHFKDEVTGYFYQILSTKYSGNRDLCTKILEGKTLEQLKASEEFEGDTYDIAGLLVCRTIVNSCADTIFMRRKEEQGGKLLRVTGVIFKQE